MKRQLISLVSLYLFSVPQVFSQGYNVGDQVLDFKMILGKKAFSKSFAANTSLVETIKVTENSVTKL